MSIEVTSLDIANIADESHETVEFAIKFLVSRGTIEEPDTELYVTPGTLLRHYVFDHEHKRDSLAVMATVDSDFYEDLQEHWENLEKDARDPVALAECDLRRQERDRVMGAQYSTMLYDPATCENRPYPSHAGQWRDMHGPTVAWLYNPWTGELRTATEVGDDPTGVKIDPTD